jgi:hypothetical protein
VHECMSVWCAMPLRGGFGVRMLSDDRLISRAEEGKGLRDL